MGVHLRQSGAKLIHDGDSIKWRMPKSVIFWQNFTFQWHSFASLCVQLRTIHHNQFYRERVRASAFALPSFPFPPPLDLRKSYQSSGSLRGYDLIPDKFMCDFGVILDPLYISSYLTIDMYVKTVNTQCMHWPGQIIRDNQVFCLFISLEYY